MAFGGQIFDGGTLTNSLQCPRNFVELRRTFGPVRRIIS